MRLDLEVTFLVCGWNGGALVLGSVSLKSPHVDFFGLLYSTPVYLNRTLDRWVKKRFCGCKFCLKMKDKSIYFHQLTICIHFLFSQLLQVTSISIHCLNPSAQSFIHGLIVNKFRNKSVWTFIENIEHSQLESKLT